MPVLNTINAALLSRGNTTRTPMELSEDGAAQPVPLPSEQNIGHVLEGPQQRSPKESVDINGFFALVKDVIDFKLARDGWSKPLIFTEDFPDSDDDINEEIITFGIQKRMPALMEQSTNAMKRNPLRARKPIFMEHLNDPEFPGYKVEVSGWLYDNFVQFTCWARENKIANIRALWFEELMMEYEWVFQASGISFVRYEGRGEDVEDRHKNSKRVGRPMVYLIRTQKVLAKYDKAIEEIGLRFNILSK